MTQKPRELFHSVNEVVGKAGLLFNVSLRPEGYEVLVFESLDKNNLLSGDRSSYVVPYSVAEEAGQLMLCVELMCEDLRNIIDTRKAMCH